MFAAVMLLERDLVCAVLYQVKMLLRITTLALAPRAQRSFTVYLAFRPTFAPLLTLFHFCTSQLSHSRHSSSLLELFNGLRLNFIQTSSELRPPSIRFSNAIMSPSERAIALFLSQTSSTRNRAILYLTITDGNADEAVALFNSKPNESFRAALSRPAAQFRRPLANDAKGYEDKDGLIHLETSSDGEAEDEDAAEGKIVVKATTKVGRRNRGEADRDSTYEPEEIITSLDHLSRTGRDELPRLRNRGHRGRYAMELRAPRVKSLAGTDNAKSISARKLKSLKRVERLTPNSQGPRLRPRNNLPTYGSPKRRVVGEYSLW